MSDANEVTAVPHSTSANCRPGLAAGASSYPSRIKNGATMTVHREKLAAERRQNVATAARPWLINRGNDEPRQGRKICHLLRPYGAHHSAKFDSTGLRPWLLSDAALRLTQIIDVVKIDKLAERLTPLTLVRIFLFAFLFFAGNAQAQNTNYSLKFTVATVPSWAGGASNANTITVQNNGSSVIPANTTLYIENDMAVYAPGRKVKPNTSPSVTVSPSSLASLIPGSCVSTPLFSAYGRYGCRVKLLAQLG